MPGWPKSQALPLSRPAAGHKQASSIIWWNGGAILFNISYDVMLYDLTSTYFEADPPFPKATSGALGYSRDHGRIVCRSFIALVVTPEGLPLAYECCPATPRQTTLWGFLERIERQYARRVGSADGPRRADRGGARRDARCRPAGAYLWARRRAA